MSESEAVSVIYHTVCEDAVVPVRLDESADSALV